MRRNITGGKSRKRGGASQFRGISSGNVTHFRLNIYFYTNIYIKVEEEVCRMNMNK